MNRKEVAEIKRILSPEKGLIKEIYTAYVNAEGERISFDKVPMVEMTEEEYREYMKIFKKVLTGRIERNFLNLNFSNSTDSIQESLYKIIKNHNQEDLVEQVFDRIIENFPNEAGYTIFMCRGVYDVPSKASDGFVLEGSDRAYEFIVTAICPIKLSKTNLVYSNDEGKFVNSPINWLVAPPELGFLYPSFTARTSNVNELGYYIKNPDVTYEDFQNQLLGCQLPMGASDQKEAFIGLLEESFEGRVPMKAVISVNESARLYSEDKDLEGEVGPMAKFEIEDMLRASGAPKVEIDPSLKVMAENIAEKKYTFESEGIKIQVDEKFISQLSQEDVQGRKSLVIPLSQMTLNGIPIK